MLGTKNVIFSPSTLFASFLLFLCFFLLCHLTNTKIFCTSLSLSFPSSPATKNVYKRFHVEIFFNLIFIYIFFPAYFYNDAQTTKKYCSLCVSLSHGATGWRGAWLDGERNNKRLKSMCVAVRARKERRAFGRGHNERMRNEFSSNEFLFIR